MMKLRTVTGTALITGLPLVALSGCERGPSEKASESVQNAGRDARD